MFLAAAIPALVQGASTLIGGKMQQDGNAKAARLAAIQNAMAQERRERGLGEQKEVLSGAQGSQIDAILQAAQAAAQYLVGGGENAANAYRGGTQSSNEELRRQIVANAPGMARLREAIGSEGELTPFQRQQIAEADRVGSNSIRSSSIGGSGRTAAAILKKIHSDSRLGALEANRQASMSAAGILAGNENNARGRIASNESELGARLGNLYDQTGLRLAGAAGDAGSRIAGIFGNTAGQISNAIGSTYGANANTDEATGKVQANAASANGQIGSQTAGALGGIIADQIKSSKYTPTNLGTTPGSGGLY